MVTKRGPRAPLAVVGGDLNALAAARALGPHGVPVTVLHDGRGGATLRRSRWVDTFVGVPHGSVPDPVWEQWLGTAPEGTVLLPGSDEGLQFVAERHDDLRARGLRPVELAPAAVRDLLSKARAHEVAVRAGVPTPTVVELDDLADAPTVADTLGYPCAIKPVRRHEAVRSGPGARLGKGAIVHDEAELRAVCARLGATDARFLLTEVIPGPDEAYCSYYTYLDEQGRPLVHASKTKVRQYPRHFGGGTFHRTRWHPEAARLGLTLFREAGVRGVANVEFKRDPRDGRYKLIEANLRITGPTRLLQRAGVDLVTLAYERACGHRGQEPRVPSPAGFREGLEEVRIGDDLRALAAGRAAGELRLVDWVRSFSPRTRGALFRWDDPGPAVGHLAGRAAAGLARLRRGPTR